MEKNYEGLNEKKMRKAVRSLFKVVKFLDKHNIHYTLEGGTLLGIVRDNSLLPWDHDVDVAIDLKDAKKLNKLRFRMLFSGYRVTMRKSKREFGAIKEGQIRIFKVKQLIPSIMKEIFPKALERLVITDIFVKASDDKHTYWMAMEKIMRVDKKYYEGYEELEFEGVKLKTPMHYKDYLTEKYGDWSIPVKDWVCGHDEKTICD